MCVYMCVYIAWGDEKVSMRQSEVVPLDRAFTQAEWIGSKIKQIATMTPQHVAEKIPKIREWRLNQIGLMFMGSAEQPEAGDRDLEPQDAKIKAKVVRKTWILVKGEEIWKGCSSRRRRRGEEW